MLTLKANDLNDEGRVRVNVFRQDGGLYTPLTNEINFLIEATALPTLSDDLIEIELFKDFLKVELSGIYLPLPPLGLLYKPCYRFMWQILFPLAKYYPGLALFTAYCGIKK